MGESIIISSGKGGTGKTSVAINLGNALSELGKSVALIDGSLTTPDVSLYLGIPFHVRGIGHILKEDSPIDAACFNHKSGMKIIPGNIHLDVLNEFEGKSFVNLLKKLKKQHDFVLIDSAAGLGREAVSAIKNSDKILIVTNPELASVVDSSKTIQLAKHHKVEPIGVVLNRIGRHNQELKEEDILPIMHGIPIIAKIPEDKKMSIATKNSETILYYYPKNSISKKFRELAFNVSGMKKPSFFRRFLNWLK